MKSRSSKGPTRAEIIASAWAAVEATASPARDPEELKRDGWRSPHLEYGGDSPEARRVENLCRKMGFEKQLFPVLAGNGSKRNVTFYRPRA